MKGAVNMFANAGVNMFRKRLRWGGGGSGILKNSVYTKYVNSPKPQEGEGPYHNRFSYSEVVIEQQILLNFCSELLWSRA